MMIFDHDVGNAKAISQNQVHNISKSDIHEEEACK